MEANVTSTNSSRRYPHVIDLESWDKSARSELYYTSMLSGYYIVGDDQSFSFDTGNGLYNTNLKIYCNVRSTR